MKVERDNYGPFHVRGTSSEGRGSWKIQVWLKGSNQEGPEDHQFSVENGIVTGYDVPTDERDAVMALIDQWEEKLPLMVASPV